MIGSSTASLDYQDDRVRDLYRGRLNVLHEGCPKGATPAPTPTRSSSTPSAAPSEPKTYFTDELMLRLALALAICRFAAPTAGLAALILVLVLGFTSPLWIALALCLVAMLLAYSIKTTYFPR